MAQYHSTEQDQPRNIEINSQMFHQENTESDVTSPIDLPSGNTTQIKYDSSAKETEQGYFNELYKV